MTDERKQSEESDLDALFREASENAAEPSPDLMARIAADAERFRPDKGFSIQTELPAWRKLLDAIGGWPALGGMVTAGAAGIYLGFLTPELSDLSSVQVEEGEFIQLFPDDALFFDEELL